MVVFRRGAVMKRRCELSVQKGVVNVGFTARRFDHTTSGWQRSKAALLDFCVIVGFSRLSFSLSTRTVGRVI